MSEAPAVERRTAAAPAVRARRSARATKPADTAAVAVELPVARVAVDVPLAHLDRPFDYLVPAAMAATAVPGVRVRVRLAGALVDGFVLERAEASDHPGPLARLARVVSPEPVLTPAVARTARAVADRCAGTLADVLRLAVPARHARIEGEQRADAGLLPPPAPDPAGWAGYPGGPGFLGSLAAGGSARAAWTALPATTADPFDGLGRALVAVAASGRGGLAVLPDARDVERLATALAAVEPALPVAVLTADLGPAERYRRWLSVLRGQVRTVVGTRAAAWAPVADLGLLVCWDDGDDLHAEPLAPYPHVRDVLLLRAHDSSAGVLLGGHAMTAEAAELVERRWLRPLTAPRAEVRRVAPLVRVAGDDLEQERDAGARAARLPSLAWRAAREGLTTGPVLVQTLRRGYVPVLACRSCRAAARCPRCTGPVGAAEAQAVPTCGWCGWTAADGPDDSGGPGGAGGPSGAGSPRLRCDRCGGEVDRAQRVGARRTAEELGRAFPGSPVRTSSGDAVLSTVGPSPAIVVATPGAEPVAEGGYAAALLLDGDLALTRPSLRAGEEALRRWLGAAALVRARAPVVVVAAGAAAPVQALVRWDPVGFARHELADRRSAGLPPAGVVVELEGAAGDLDDLLDRLELPGVVEVLGPLPVEPRGRQRRTGAIAVAPPRQRALLRAPAPDHLALARAVRAATAVRTAAKRGGHVRVRVDPVDLA